MTANEPINRLLSLPVAVRKIMTSFLELKDFACRWRLIHPQNAAQRQLSLTSEPMRRRKFSLLHLAGVYEKIENLDLAWTEDGCLPPGLRPLLSRPATDSLRKIQICPKPKDLEELLLLFAHKKQLITHLQLPGGHEGHEAKLKSKRERRQLTIVEWVKHTAPHLRVLIVDKDMFFLRPHFDNLIRDMSNLTELFLRSTACWPANNASLKLISQSCPQLQRLSIGGSDVDHHGIASLRSIAGTLQSLFLDSCKRITNECAPAIGALTSLRRLHLDGTRLDGRLLKVYGIVPHCNCEAEFCKHEKHWARGKNAEWLR